MVTLIISYIILQSLFLTLTRAAAGVNGINALPSTQCNHLDAIVTNQCISNSAGGSFKYVCTDGTTIEERYYSGLNCDESQLESSFPSTCSAENNCYCGATDLDETACDSDDVTVIECNPGFQQVYNVLLDHCLISDGGSHSYQCNDNGEFVLQSYDNVNCQLSVFSVEEIYPTSCQSGAELAVICGLAVDRITSDCAGNEIERETVVLDECNLNTTEPFQYFCNENNQLGLKYYDPTITYNCEGEPKQTYILDTNGDCADGLIFSSTCGGFIPVETKNTVQRITLDCDGNVEESEEVTTNHCELEPFQNGLHRPYEYFCNENDQLGLKYYTRGSGNCDGAVQLETILDSNGECIDGNIFDSTCHEIPKCATNQFECDDQCFPNSWICDSIPDCSDNSDEMNCPPVECGINQFKCEMDNKCISQSWVCDSIQDCSDNSDEINCASFSPTYSPIEHVTASPIQHPTVYPTVSPTKHPVTVTRLCTEELQQFNIGATYQFNGGCQEHFSSLIFQDAKGNMDYEKCLKKCDEMSECKSFLFGKQGVTRQNWCNIYNVECTDNGDTDWYMFIPINNAEVMCDSNN